VQKYLQEVVVLAPVEGTNARKVFILFLVVEYPSALLPCLPTLRRSLRISCQGRR